MEDVKKLCVSCRRNAKNERVLLHYNGHGVPRPTVNGEVWVFNKSYTQYIPLSIYDLQAWTGNPAICVRLLRGGAGGELVPAGSLNTEAERQLGIERERDGYRRGGGCAERGVGGGAARRGRTRWAERCRWDRG